MPRLLAHVIGFVLDAPKASREVPDRLRNDKMDAFIAHIHRNKHLTVDSVSQALADSKEKKTARS